MKHRLAVAAVVLATCVLGTPDPGAAQTEGGPAIVLTPVATLDDPIAMAARPGSTDLYVAEREGIVRRLEVDGTTVTTSTIPVVNVTAYTNTSNERGLLGLAFNPQGTKLYLHYTNNAGDTRLVEYRMNASGRRAIGSSRRLVLAIRQPDANHNGGTVTFGPDNRLYLALGDGGGSGDPHRNAQNRRRLLGKVLRINPNPYRGRPYSVPGQNPFVGQKPRRGEIWLSGVRNPWRISFDQATGDLYVGDVGQGAQEEIDVLPANANGRNAGRGANLGWRRMEGTAPFAGLTEPADHTPPTFTYDHGGGRCAVIGGHVYRGDAVPELDGIYLYGDFCTGTIGGLEAVDGALVDQADDLGIPVPDFTLQGFGQDHDGEIFVLASNGTVARVDPD